MIAEQIFFAAGLVLAGFMLGRVYERQLELDRRSHMPRRTAPWVLAIGGATVFGVVVFLACGAP